MRKKFPWKHHDANLNGRASLIYSTGLKQAKFKGSLKKWNMKQSAQYKYNNVELECLILNLENTVVKYLTVEYSTQGPLTLFFRSFPPLRVAVFSWINHNLKHLHDNSLVYCFRKAYFLLPKSPLQYILYIYIIYVYITKSGIYTVYVCIYIVYKIDPTDCYSCTEFAIPCTTFF